MIYNLSQITTPYYCAGILWNENDRVIKKAAPILQWSVGKTIDYLQMWCKKKKYKYELLTNTMTAS